MNAFAFETLTVPSGNVTASLTRSKYLPDAKGLPVRKALVTVNPGAPISYVFTGTASSAVGHKATSFGTFTIDDCSNIISFNTTSMSSGTTGEISVTYYR